MPATTSFVPSGNAAVDGLLGAEKWAVNSFTYSFPADASLYGRSYGDGEAATGFRALNGVQVAAARAALAEYAAVANLTFTEIAETATQHADLRYAMSDLPGTAWAYFPSPEPEGGDTWLNNSRHAYDNPVRGSYAYHTVLHETGHALGLEHAHASGMPSSFDAMPFTIMSYRSYVGGSATTGYSNETWGYAQSLMTLDIAAVQHLHGANFATRSGDTVYSWSPATGQGFVDGVAQAAPGGNRIFQTVWDGGGIDTYDFSNYGTALSLSLEPGAWTTPSPVQLASLGYGRTAPGSIANALQYQGDPRSLIENAIGGSAGDQITGNAAANTLRGEGGGDTLRGQGGADALMGGVGDDVLDGGEGVDTAVLSGAASAYSWWPNADGSWTLAGAEGTDLLVGVEFLQFGDGTAALSGAGSPPPAPPSAPPPAAPTATIVPPPPVAPPAPPDAPVVTPPVTPDVTRTGSSLDDSLSGGAGADILAGLGGSDTLTGLGGNDLLVGGRGRDLLFGGEGADRFDFNAAAEAAPGAARDAVKDFQTGLDAIDLKGIDANRDKSGNQAFAWVDSRDLDAAFTGEDGQLRFAGGSLTGDTNGDGKADFQIAIVGRLVAGDVIL